MTTRAPAVGLGLIGLALLVVIGLAAWTPPPWGFLTRADLPQCPPVSRDRPATDPPGPDPPGTEAAGRCLFDERAGRRGAELVVTSTTDEGGEIHTYYRRLPGSPGLELWSDAGADPYGSGGWTHEVCPAATSLTTVGTCRQA